MAGVFQVDSIFKYANEGILISNAQGEVEHVNPRCAELFGYKLEEMIGIQIEKLIPMEHRGNHVSHREKYNKAPRNRSMGKNLSLSGLKKDGSVFPIEISLSHYQENEVRWVIAFIIDISERLKYQENLKEINWQLSQLNENLERKVKERTLVLQEALNDLGRSRDELQKLLLKEKELHEMKSRFVAMASHEFRTPLTTILSSVSLISKYTSTEEQIHRDKHIQRVRNAVFGLTEVLNDVLSLGKLDEGKVEVQLEPLLLHVFLNQTLGDLEPLLEESQRFECVFPENITILSDASLLTRVIVNLVSNALKFSEGHHPVKLSVIRLLENDIFDIVIEISNKGVGIPHHEIDRIFDRFYRAKNATNISGTGLGLSIVKRCMELMKGEISVENREDGWTVFKVYCKELK